MSPSILERVTHKPPRPPSYFAPIDVSGRWQAMRTLYKAQAQRERRRG